MGRRFGHDFGRVRVHAGPLAGRSAEALQAQAYTLGSHVIFGPGRYAPRSLDGQRLLAHELTDVVQQAASPAQGVQRQPDPAPKSETKEPKPKNLKDMGISARDPVSAKTMVPLIDAVFKRNPTIAPYIADRLTQGREIGEKEKFIVHPTAATFETDYEKYIGKRADSVPRGFDREYEVSGKKQKYRDEIHLPPDATFGEAFHEAVHKMSGLSITRYLADDPDLAFDLNEGLTSLFSVLILKDEGVTNYTDGYASKRRKAEKLVDDGRFDAVAKWYWIGTVADLLKKLGVKPGSKNEQKDAIRELKKITG